jgi:hypothetical protein
VKRLLLSTLMFFGSIQAANQAAAGAQAIADALDQQEADAANLGAAGEKRAVAERKRQMDAARNSNVEKASAAIQEKNPLKALGFYAALENDQDRDVILGAMVDDLEPRDFDAKTLGRYQELLLKFKKNTGRLPNFFEQKKLAMWKPYLSKVFPVEVVPLDIGEQPEKDVKTNGPVMRQTAEANRQVVLKSKDGQQFVVDRSFVTNKRYSVVLSTAFLDDPDAHEMDVNLSGEILGQLIQGMKTLEKYYHVHPEDLNLKAKVSANAFIGFFNKHLPVANRFLPDLIKDANYMGSKELLEYYVFRYTSYLYELKYAKGPYFPQSVANELARYNFPLDLLRLIATRYFWRYTVGIERDANQALEIMDKNAKMQPQPIASASGGVAAPASSPEAKKQARRRVVVALPFEELRPRGLSPELLELFPNLAKEPNEIRDLKGRKFSALLWAVQRGNDLNQVILLSRLSGIDIDQPVGPYNKRALVEAILVPRDPENHVLEVLLSAGADTEVADDAQGTPLWHAVEARCEPAVRLLIRAGANVDVRSSLKGRSQTLLQYAVDQENVPMVSLLIDAGADVNAHDANGVTVWGYAINAFTDRSGNIERPHLIIDRLRQAGVKEVETVPNVSRAKFLSGTSSKK